MKKQIIILVLLFFNCLLVWSQGGFVKTTTPCNKELLLKTPGNWMPLGRGFNATISKQQELEMLNRLIVIQKLVFNIYPSPRAFDAVQGFFTFDKDFATQLKIESSAYGPRYFYINGTSITNFGYAVKFCAYHCGRTPNEIMKGSGCEAGTNVVVDINNLDDFFTRITLEDFYADNMRIDGRPVKMMPWLKGKWKDYDLYSPENGSGVNMVLLHREGMLPYIPVTRKQYLDRSIACLQRFFDKNKKAYEQPEGLILLMDKKERDELIKKQQKLRDDVIKYYKDELDATTRAGLPDSPAIIPGSLAYPDVNVSIFTTSAAGGRMLVTENPVYFKKDLPKYIPQLMVYSMRNSQDGPDPTLNPYKLYDENFPIEKLQAMIDK